jgi:hypothetical protein
MMISFVAFILIVSSIFEVQCFVKTAPRIRRFYAIYMRTDSQPQSTRNYELHEKKTLTLPILSALLWNAFPSMSSAGGFLRSDELEVVVEGDYVGLGLKEESYGGSLRVVVQSIKNDAEASVVSRTRPGMILVSLNGESVEGLSRNTVAAKVKDAKRPLTLVLRDPGLFFSKLNSTSVDAFSGDVVDTCVAADGQVLMVERVEVCTFLCLLKIASSAFDLNAPLRLSY